MAKGYEIISYRHAGTGMLIEDVSQVMSWEPLAIAIAKIKAGEPPVYVENAFGHGWSALVLRHGTNIIVRKLRLVDTFLVKDHENAS